MPRLFFVVLAVTILCQFETLNASCKVSAQTGCAPCYRPSSDPDKKIENKPANVTALTVSTDELTLPCEAGSLPREGVIVSPSMVIDVATIAEDAENDVLKYSYTVSGGRIIGVGANVKWDLSQVAPGTYTITGAVDDGCGICGRYQTKTVTVAAADCSGDCECPLVDLQGPSRLVEGSNTFTVQVTGGTQSEVKYEWRVENGQISEGQGNPTVRVRVRSTRKDPDASVTVRIGAMDPSCGCPSEQTKRYKNGRLIP